MIFKLWEKFSARRLVVSVSMDFFFFFFFLIAVWKYLKVWNFSTSTGIRSFLQARRISVERFVSLIEQVNPLSSKADIIYLR